MVDMKKYEFNVSDDKKHYITHGIQYYILGRISVYNFFHLFNLNVSTVLFHNAIEYLLKALLLDYYSIEQLKNKRHDLPTLLTLYKNKFPNGTLIKFEDFIKKFHIFYSKRYVQSDKSHVIPESWSPTKEADSYSSPVSKKPFFARSSGVFPEGNWYHPVDKLYYPRNRNAINLYDMQKEEDYKIPCPCKICEAYTTFKKIEEDAKERTEISEKKYTTEFNNLWNEYRRRHWFCYKDLETEELQRDDTRLIKEVIARSQRQDLHSFFQ